MNPPIPTPVKVSVVIVCVNHPDLLRRCLDSLRAQTTRTTFETWVVAHRFSPENLRWLQTAYPWVEIVESSGTLGFSENNNLALRRARGEYCFLLNDDTVMDSPVLDRLAGDLDRHPEIAMVSPVLVWADGRVQFKGLVRMTAWRWFLREMRWDWAGKSNAPEEGGPGGPKGLYRTAHLMGAALMARRSVLAGLGYLDERFFFGPEDTALTEAANAAGHACFIDGDVRLPHLKSESLHREFIPVMLALQRGYLLYYGRHGLLAKLWVRLLAAILDLARLAYWSFRGPGENASVHRRAAWLLLKTLPSRKTPKQLFIQYCGSRQSETQTHRHSAPS